MARMFSTDFIYKETNYTATVIISGIDGKKTISIQVPEALHKIIPGGKIIVEPHSQNQKPENGISKDPALIKSILASVEKHEEAKPPRGLWN